MSKISDFEFNNLRFLGGQIGKLYPEYIDLGKLDMGMSIALFFLKNRKRWKENPDKEAVRNEKLYYLGQVLKMPLFSEVTILSMMLGDKTEQTWDASGKSED